MTTVLHVEGMSCQNCARHVRDAIQSLPGISYARVDLDKAEAVVKWKNGNASEENLIKALETAGYPSQVLKEPSSESSESAGSGWKFNVILGSAVTVPLMVAWNGVSAWQISLGFAGRVFCWFCPCSCFVVRGFTGARGSN